MKTKYLIGKGFFYIKSIMLSLSLLLGTTGVTPSISELENEAVKIDEEIKVLESGIKDNKAAKEELDEDLLQVEENMTDLEKKIIKVKNRITTSENEIEKLGVEIDKLNGEIMLKEDEIKEKSKEINIQKEKLGKTLSFMYENRESNIFEFVFNSENINELLNTMGFINTIAEENESIYLNFTKEKEELEVIKEELSKQKSKVNKAKDEQHKLKDELTKDKSELDGLMEEFKEEEEEILERIAEEEAREKKAMEEIFKQVAEKEAIMKEKAEIERLALQKKREEEARKQEEERQKEIEENGESDIPPPSGEKPSVGGNGFALPMKSGTYRVSSEYGYRVHPTTGQKGSHHNGIDLAAPHGTPIYAAGDGAVLFAGPASGFGNWVVIAHDNGLYTIYGHMKGSNIYVKPGQYVEAGHHIAGVGSEGMSTGPHLHFEIATGRSGTAFTRTNPRGYLSF